MIEQLSTQLLNLKQHIQVRPNVKGRASFDHFDGCISQHKDLFNRMPDVKWLFLGEHYEVAVR
jgi:hypothetical protein